MHRKSCSESTSKISGSLYGALVCDLHAQFHTRMDRADHLHVTGLLEGDVGRRARRLRAKIELVVLAGRHDVMRHAVVIEEGERSTLLDRHAFRGEGASLLMNHLGGRKGASRKASGNDEGKECQLAHEKYRVG